MRSEFIDTLIIGGGQAGLAMSHMLSQRGCPNIVVERHRIAERWRTERWDGLRFQFPNWSIQLPDFPFPYTDPDAFATSDEIVRYDMCSARGLSAGPEADILPLFDHLVGAAEQRQWHRETERLGGLEVDDQLYLRQLLDRQICRLIAFQNPAGVDAGRTKRVRKTGSVAHEAAGRCELARLVDRGHGVTNRQCRELFEPATEEWIGADHERTCSQLAQGCENRIEIAFVARM